MSAKTYNRYTSYSGNYPTPHQLVYSSWVEIAHFTPNWRNSLRYRTSSPIVSARIRYGTSGNYVYHDLTRPKTYDDLKDILIGAQVSRSTLSDLASGKPVSLSDILDTLKSPMLDDEKLRTHVKDLSFKQDSIEYDLKKDIAVLNIEIIKDLQIIKNFIYYGEDTTAGFHSKQWSGVVVWLPLAAFEGDTPWIILPNGVYKANVRAYDQNGNLLEEYFNYQVIDY